jgi:hypothetical protein
MKRSILMALAVVCGLGCSEPTRPGAHVRVSVASDSIVGTIVHAGDVDWLHFSLTVAIENRGGAPVEYTVCLSSIEGYDGAGWSTVWSPACFVLAASDGQVAPGETRQFELDVTAAIAGPGGPTWNSPQVAGMYRFQAGVYATDGSSIDVNPSNGFILRTQ